MTLSGSVQGGLRYFSSPRIGMISERINLQDWTQQEEALVGGDQAPW